MLRRSLPHDGVVADIADAAPPRLVNLTGEPVLVVAEGAVVRLDDGAPPLPWEDDDDDDDERRVCRFRVRAPGPTFQVEAVPTAAAGYVGPPETPGLVWLVDEAMQSQFPHRSDLVSAAAFDLVDLATTDLDITGLDAVTIDEGGVGGLIFVLRAVATSITPHVADPVPVPFENPPVFRREHPWEPATRPRRAPLARSGRWVARAPRRRLRRKSRP